MAQSYSSLRLLRLDPAAEREQGVLDRARASTINLHKLSSKHPPPTKAHPTTEYVVVLAG